MHQSIKNNKPILSVFDTLIKIGAIFITSPSLKFDEKKIKILSFSLLNDKPDESKLIKFVSEMTQFLNIRLSHCKQA